MTMLFGAKKPAAKAPTSSVGKGTAVSFYIFFLINLYIYDTYFIILT
jgi:hypothetical protein